MRTDCDLDLTIVVVDYKAQEQVSECLRSLARFTSEISSEVIIVDNTPGATAEEPSPSASGPRRIVSGRNLGYGAACNLGMKEARGRYVFFLNPDVRFQSGSAVELIQWLDAHPDVGAVGPRIINPDGSRQSSCRSFPGWSTALCGSASLLTRLFPANPWSRRYLRSDLDEETSAVDWISGCCLVARREALAETGGFDPRFFLFFEDVDLCYRFKLAGWRRMYNPALCFVHEIGISRAYLPDRGRKHHYLSAARYFGKHLVRNRWLSRLLNAAADMGASLTGPVESARRGATS